MKEGEYTPKMMGVGRPAERATAPRTKKFRIIFERGHKILRDSVAGIPRAGLC